MLAQLRQGKQNCTRIDVMNYTIAEKTSSYTPISNQEIIESTLEGFEKQGFRLKSENYQVQNNGNKFIGRFSLNSDETGLDMMFAFKNSYDRTMTAGYALGAQVFVCLNGVISGDERMIRKHTGTANVDIITAISEGIKRLPDQFSSVQKDLNRMKEIEITEKTINQLVGEMYINDSMLKSRQLEVLRQEIIKPSFDYGVEGTMYNMYQHITHALKTTPTTDFIQKHIEAHNFILDKIN